MAFWICMTHKNVFYAWKGKKKKWPQYIDKY